MYKRERTESLGEPNDSDFPEKLWTDFETKVSKVSEGCLRICHTSGAIWTIFDELFQLE